MNAPLAARFPEVARRWESDCGRARLLLGVGTAAVFGACLSSAASYASGDSFNLFTALYFIEAVIVLGYGTTRVIAGVSDEKRQGTWDLQRLTPQSSGELAAGKILGAPLFPLCLAGAFLPWSLFALTRSAKTTPLDALQLYLLLAAAAAFCWSLGLAVSTHADERQGVGDGVKFLLLLALYPLMASGAAGARKKESIEFFGAAFPAWLFHAGSLAVFAAWIFESARCRIARDKLEDVRSWRLPAFVVFIAVYQLGLEPKSPGLITIVPLVATLLAGIGEPWGAQEWRTWFARPARERAAYAPAWIAGLAACAVVTAPLCAFGPTPAGDPVSLRFPVLLLFFVARDLLFLQWCRLKVKRSPEIVAVVYIALAYALPAAVMMILGRHGAAFFFSAAPELERSALVNLLPGAVEAAVMAALLARAARNTLRRPSAPGARA